MPINYLRLFRAALRFFHAIEAAGAAEPSDTPSLLDAHDRLMKVLFSPNLSYAENLAALKEEAAGSEELARG